MYREKEGGETAGPTLRIMRLGAVQKKKKKKEIFYL
jgi:hypothetical protein